eukprot:s2909_g1.t1
MPCSDRTWRWVKILGAAAWLLAAAPLYTFIIHEIYLQLGQDSDDPDDADAHGLRFLGPTALWLDCCVKLFFFMTVWQAAMDLLVLAQHGSNQAARSALMLGPEKYEDLYYFFTNHEREDDFFPCLVGGGRLHSKELVEVVRKDRAMRVLKLIGLLGRVAVTTGGMILNLRALPKRHPTKPLNQARYYVVYLELIVLGWYWTMLLYRLLQWIVDTKLSYMGAVLADAARDIASWSSMQLLRNLSMSRLAQRTERVMKECKYFFAPSMQYIMGLIEAVGYITSGLFGVAVLAVKATQIDFVSVHMMSAYSIGEWLRLVSFTMSMVNIFDIDTENRRAVQEFLTSDYDQVVTGMQWPPPIFVAWERTLASLVAAKEGFWTSFLLMATISGKDYKRFLIEEDPEECPVLLKELLTKHPLSSERSAAALKKGMKQEEIERIKTWIAEEGGPQRYFNSLGAYTKLSSA